MEQHLKILGVLYIVLGALGILGALVMLAVFGGIAGVVGMVAHQEPDARIAVPIVAAIGIGLFFSMLVLSLPGLVAGYGLLRFRPWARVLGIVLSALNLLSAPLGTLLGAYGLWVLLSEETELLFRKPAPPSF